MSTIKQKALIVAALLALMLAGCSIGGKQDKGQGSLDTRVFEVEVNGESVTCIWASSHYKGGLSCDW